MKRNVFFLFFGFSIVLADAQPKLLLPENGGKGIPAFEARSFVIIWDTVGSASYYEYVISDNPNCFKGCSGDTRNETTPSTSATEYAMQINKWYYWIVRVFYTNGDTSNWSGIWSFFTEPSADNEVPFILAFPNPARSNVNLRIQWTQEPDITTLSVDLFSLDGRIISRNQKIVLQKNIFQRDEIFPLPTTNLSPGIYLAVIREDNITKKVVKIAIL